MRIFLFLSIWRTNGKNIKICALNPEMQVSAGGHSVVFKGQFYLLNSIMWIYLIIYSLRQREWIALFSTDNTIFQAKNEFRSKLKIMQFHSAKQI